ncbi:Calcineurin-like phosphoesterase domain, ApaH type,Metallo-dependent phosphatase-like [Cinara cedri]|uniref:Calcineurin-like phosphoesterase domain, ApaH type,Metallo-dependent phosphatase-like n=1 Tax=Cinara cedri TaxID=506608 RepID=A0A5E4NHR0_9HEMI|nr:Calcineurin-like phosphoesterase domain, ApaH type,Metallo-dependent phosphatase-like [Cinara cedri]
MLFFTFIVFAISVNTASHASQKIGYFWHITDIHYDAEYAAGDYKKSCKDSYSDQDSPSLPNGGGKLGNYRCDSPWPLVQSAVKAMKEKHGDNIEFVLWSGDSVSSDVVDVNKRMMAIENVTNLLARTFSSQFVFPVLGHDDPGALKGTYVKYTESGHYWRHWLPTDAIQTFNKGGYYTIEQKGNKLRIIALNSNLFLSTKINQNVPNEQLQWLENILKKSVTSKETVYLVSHMCPGANERDPDEAPTFIDKYSTRYLAMIRKYANIIVGQFCGHLHSDTFRIVYDTKKIPVSWMMIAPSLTPNKSPIVSNNPGLRLYKFNVHTGHIIDYTQYYIDLESSANGDPDDWKVEYNMTSYYNLHNISAKNLHAIAETFQQIEKSDIFDRYIEANSVRHYKPKDCNLECRRAHYCAVTELDYQQFRSCVETTPEALSGSARPPSVFVTASTTAAVLLTATVALIRRLQ